MIFADHFTEAMTRHDSCFVFLLSILTIFCQPAESQIVLSEIMFNPQGDERTDEYVEIFNSSNSDTINLNGWLLTDGNKFNIIQSWQQGTELFPRHYAVIFLAKYYEQSRAYDKVIPAEALCVTVNASVFGSYGLANTTDEAVGIYRPDSTLACQWQYSTPNPDGISDEKKVIDREDDFYNWGNSVAVGGTPGFRNSVSLLACDLALNPKNFIFSPVFPGRNDSIRCFFWIQNHGMNSMKEVSITIYNDLDLDASGETDEILLHALVNTHGIQWPDSVAVTVTLPPLPVGTHSLLIELIAGDDENLSNNTLVRPVSVHHAFHEILIHEIYASPLPGEGCWIELINDNDEPLLMKQWVVEFPLQNKKVTIAATPMLIYARGMILLSQQEMLLSVLWDTKSPVYRIGNALRFDSRHEIFLLKDEFGALIDSVAYDLDSDRTGISLERSCRTLNSWGFCSHPNGKTPGEYNALDEQFADPGFKINSLSLWPERPVYGRDVWLQSTVYNFGNQNAGNFRLTITERDCVQVVDHHSVHAIAPSDSLSIRFPYENAKPGIHSIACSLSSENDRYPANNAYSAEISIRYPQKCLVINEIMYDTDTREQEWIELYNPGHDPVDLRLWKIRDNRQTVLITDASFVVAPGSFAVLSHVKLASKHDIVFSNLINTELPELNNSGDVVALYDHIDRMIDSTCYTTLSSAMRFKSLERVHELDSSLNSANWHMSIDSSGSTPGYANSCSPQDFDLAVVDDSIKAIPKNPKEGDDVDIRLIVKNAGRFPVHGASLSFRYRSAGEENSTLFDEGIPIPNLDSGQQQEVVIQWPNVPGGCYELYLQLHYDSDSVNSNNTARLQVYVSYSCGAVINEIMYDPLSQDKEWLEIMNAGSVSLQLIGWTLSGEDTSRKYPICDSLFTLMPDQFLTITADSEFHRELASTGLNSVLAKLPALNNTEDFVYMFDPNHRLMECVHYHQLWGGEDGRSLERINPRIASDQKSNWSTCVARGGHTAGRVNSLFTPVIPSNVTLSISPDPFSPDMDGREDIAAICYSVPAATAMINIKIFDIAGRMVRYLCNNEPSGAHGSVFWDGLDDNGRKCRIGLYIVYLQALSQSQRAIYKTTKAVVVAGML